MLISQSIISHFKYLIYLQIFKFKHTQGVYICWQESELNNFALDDGSFDHSYGSYLDALVDAHLSYDDDGSLESLGQHGSFDSYVSL